MKLSFRIPAAAALFTGSLFVAVSPAAALPPGGAGPDTPGTSATISPTTVTQCERISYRVTGFPAGETVNVKIDDGAGYSDQSVHGSGVVSRQRIAEDGTASGSVVIDCDTTPGTHWLRFLASSEIIDEKTGEYKGVDGYTRRGADFTVVARSAPGAGATGSRNTGGSGTASRVEAVNVDELKLDSKADREFLENRGGADTATDSKPDSQPADAAAPATAAAAAGAAASTPRNNVSSAVTITSVVEENITRGGGADSSTGREPTSVQSTLAVDLPDSATTGDDSATTGDASSTGKAATTGTTGTPDSTATDGAGASTAAAPVAAPAPTQKAPFIGLLVGGAILLVGFGGIGSYLYVNRRKN